MTVTAMSPGRFDREIAEIGFVLRHEQNLRRSADAKPGQLGERLVAQQAGRAASAFSLSDRGRCRESSCGALPRPHRAMPPAPCVQLRAAPARACAPARAIRADRCPLCRARRCGRQARLRTAPARSQDEIATRAASACGRTPAPDNAASTPSVRSPPASRNCRRANAAPVTRRAAPAPMPVRPPSASTAPSRFP